LLITVIQAISFFNDNARGDAYSQGYGVNDVIGCGYLKNGNSWSYYFVKNGKCLPIAYSTSYLTNETYAVIGCDGDCSVTVNFGESPFRYAELANRPVYNTNNQNINSTYSDTLPVYQQPPPQTAPLQFQQQTAPLQFQQQVSPMFQPQQEQQQQQQQFIGQPPTYQQPPSYQQPPIYQQQQFQPIQQPSIYQ